MLEEQGMSYFEDQGLAVMIGSDAVLGFREGIYSELAMDSTNCINVAEPCCSWLCPCEYFITDRQP